MVYKLIGNAVQDFANSGVANGCGREVNEGIQFWAQALGAN